jgi:NitT/TauT family transport system permease protein
MRDQTRMMNLLKRSALARGRFPLSLETTLSIASPLLVLLLWEGLVRLGYLEALFFPPPTRIIETLVKVLISGELVSQTAITLRRMILAFALGTAPGLILGLLMGWSRKIRAFFDPLVSATLPIPKFALLPLIMLVLGVGEGSKLVTISMGIFFIILVNALAGVQGIDPIYFEAARNYGANRWQLFVKVILPGSLPMIFAGIRLALGMALLVTIATEFIAAREGLGAMTWLAWQTLRTEVLYVGIITSAILGVIFTVIVERLRKWLIPWQEEIP